MTKTICLLLALFASAQQQVRFDDVVRNLRNPDPKVRINAVRLLRDAKYPEAVVPMTPLVLDQVDDIQLEAIAAELSFFLDQDMKSKKMIGFVVEKRRSAIAEGAFELGPLVVWPRPNWSRTCSGRWRTTTRACGSRRSMPPASWPERRSGRSRRRT